jgi:hypothetical protein
MKRNKRYWIALFLFITIFMGCNDPMHVCKRKSNQELRIELFQECLKLVRGGGPETVHYNDWDEVIKTCASTAYYQSLINICPTHGD